MRLKAWQQKRHTFVDFNGLLYDIRRFLKLIPGQAYITDKRQKMHFV